VGIGTFFQQGRKLREIFRKYTTELGIDVEGAPQHGHTLPIYMRHEPLHEGRVLLVGDAAGLVDPLTGEGIRRAVDSGKFAAEAVLADDLPAYTRRVHREIGADLLWGRRWARLLYGHPHGSFQFGARNPLILQMLLRMLDGTSSYRKMVWEFVPATFRGIGRRLPVERRLGRT
jgi:flavin-dependent dehydrogenase